MKVMGLIFNSKGWENEENSRKFVPDYIYLKISLLICPDYPPDFLNFRPNICYIIFRDQSWEKQNLC